MSNFVPTGQTVGEIWRSSIFKMADVRHLGFVVRRIVDSVYRCAKFGWNLPCSYVDMKVSMSCEFGLKMANHAQKANRY